MPQGDPWANYAAMSGATSGYTGRYGFSGGLRQGQKQQAGMTGGQGGGMPPAPQGPQTGLMQLGQMTGQARNPALAAGLGQPGGGGMGGPMGAPGGGAPGGGGPMGLPGTTSIKETGDYLARLYGLDMGGQGMVDEGGSFLRTPRDADEAAKFNLISQRLADEQQKQSESKALASLQGEMGLLSRGGRGSLATIQAGTLREQARLYSEQQFTPTDFGYWIAKEFATKQENLAKYIARQQKKAAKYQMYGDIAKGVASIAVGAGMFCWVAEELFGKDDQRTHYARIYCKHNMHRPFVQAYQKHGRLWAKILRWLPFLKPLARPIWEDMATEGWLIDMRNCRGRPDGTIVERPW